MVKILLTKAVLLTSLILAIVFPGPADYLKDFLVYILVIMVTFSVKKLTLKKVEAKDKKFIALLVFLNMIILPFLYILLSSLFIQNELYKNAVILYALMPPAIGIVSLGYLYNANMKIDLYSELIAYLLSLITIPIGAYLFLRQAVNPFEVVEVILLILVLPFILSLLLRKFNISENTSKQVITACFGLVLYTIVGFNLETIVQNFGEIIDVAIVFFILRFGLLLLIYFIARKYVNRSKTILLTLFGTLKNGGVATAIALLILGPESTAALAVEILFFSFTLLLLDYLFKQDKP